MSEKKPNDEPDLRLDRPEADPIRLGPGRKRALSLDRGRLLLPEAEAEQTVDFDWASLSRLGLTRLESRAVIHHLRHGVPRYALHTELGTTRAEALTALNIGLDKLRRTPGAIGFAPILNSRRLAYRERFSSGLGSWTLNGLDGEFQRIMNQERISFHVVGLVDTDAERKNRGVLARRIVGTKLMDLRKQLEQESKTLDRVGEVLHSRRHALAEANRKLTTGEAELKKQNAAAVLEGRALDHVSFEAALAEFRSEVSAAQAEFDAALDAHRLQIDTCDRLASDIAARSTEAFALEGKDVIARIRAKIPALADDMELIHEIAAKHGQDAHALTNALFPFGERASYRSGAIQVASAATTLNRFRWEWPVLVKKTA